jgi:hypothetical protein
MIDYLLIDSKLYNQIKNQFGDTGGVYIVIWKRSNVILPINRFLGIDNSGILYIGMANCFLKRVIDLKKSVCMSENSHGFGKTLKYLRLKSTIELPSDNELFVQLFPSDDPRGLENKILLDYQIEFGELPPLNAQT